MTEASAALATLHGRPVEELQTVPSTPAVTLYLSYVDKGMKLLIEKLQKDVLCGNVHFKIECVHVCKYSK